MPEARLQRTREAYFGRLIDHPTMLAVPYARLWLAPDEEAAVIHTHDVGEPCTPKCHLVRL